MEKKYSLNKEKKPKTKQKEDLSYISFQVPKSTVFMIKTCNTTEFRV